jgi:nitrate/nitrite-specific signal transduction histidine kinase
MRERAEMVAGTLTIESAPGKGTLVVATVPLHPSDALLVTPDNRSINS